MPPDEPDLLPAGAPGGHRRRYGLLIAAALIAGACTVLAFGGAAPSDMPRTADPAAARLLDRTEVVRIAPMDLTVRLALSGEVRPVRRVTLSAEVGGVVEYAGPRAGDAVAAGDRLLTIAAGDHQRALRAEEAALAALVAERRLSGLTLDRAVELARRGATARAALEQAQGAADVLDAQIAAAESRVAQARADLDRTRVAAPFAGTVIRRSVEPGQRVGAGDVVFEIVDLSVVTLDALVPIARAADLRPGQEADFWFPEDPSLRFRGRLVRIGAEAAAGTRAVPVWFDIDNPALGLRSGSFLTGAVVLRRQAGVLAVPRDALRQADGATSVLAIRDGVAVAAPVDPGAEWPDGLVAIRAGLVAGDLVARLALSGLAPGDAVRITED